MFISIVLNNYIYIYSLCVIQLIALNDKSRVSYNRNIGIYLHQHLIPLQQHNYSVLYDIYLG